MFAILGVLFAYAVLVAMRLRNLDFSLSILVGALLIALTSGAPVVVLVEAVISTITDFTTINIAVAVILITTLGNSLQETSLMTELIEGLRGVLPPRVLLSVIPAMFGLFVVPGGALMSAPFNEPEANRLGLRPEHKTYVNVWFRHLWYWASPLSPVPILAASLAGFTLMGYLWAQFPLFFVTLAIGFLVSGTFISDGGRGSGGSAGIPEVVRGLAPIGIALFLSAVGVPVSVALVPGVLLVYLMKKMPLEEALKMAYGGVRWDLAVAVVSMLFFSDVVNIAGSVTLLFEAVTGYGVPLLAIMVVVPLLVGMISGTPTMGIGIIIPLFLPLCGVFTVYEAGVIYAGVVAGYLASPMHLCLVLTNDYYKSEMGKVYRYLVPSVVALYLIAMAYYLAMNGPILS